MSNEQQLEPSARPEGQPARPAGPSATPWYDCELFCISDYAGVSGQRCGWRGKMEETRWDPGRRVRPCPRCGQAALMELDFNRVPYRE